MSILSFFEDRKEDFREVKEFLFSEKRFLLAFLISIISAFITLNVFNFFNPKTVKPQPDYINQLNTLNDVEKNLRDLINFIENQKKTLNESQTLIAKLKDEENKLRPVVEADRNLVDAILIAQNTRQRATIWRERIMAFFIGVMASVVAAFIYSAIHQIRLKKV